MDEDFVDFCFCMDGFDYCMDIVDNVFWVFFFVILFLEWFFFKCRFFMLFVVVFKVCERFFFLFVVYISGCEWLILF